MQVPGRRPRTALARRRLAPGGVGRQRPGGRARPELDRAAVAACGQFTEWLQRREHEEPAWRDASVVASGQVWLRLDELREFGTAVEKLIEAHGHHSADGHPDDAGRVRFSLFAFPSDAGPKPSVG
jgi:hypothetical protein